MVADDVAESVLLRKKLMNKGLDGATEWGIDFPGNRTDDTRQMKLSPDIQLCGIREKGSVAHATCVIIYRRLLLNHVNCSVTSEGNPESYLMQQ